MSTESATTAHTSPAVVSFDDEPLILVDAEDEILGYAPKVDCHKGVGLLHRAFSIFIFNSDGKVLLHRRSAQKPLWPLYWTNSCCSHPRRGETLHEAAHRRLREELGMEADLELLYKFTYQARYEDLGSEYEHCAVFVGKSDGGVEVNPNEIAEWGFVDIPEMEADIKRSPDSYTPWFKMEWPTIRRDHWQVVTRL